MCLPFAIGTLDAPRCALELRSTAGKSAEAARPVLPRACITRAAAAARPRLFCSAVLSSPVRSGLENPLHQSVDGHACAPATTGDEKAGGISDGFSATGGSVEQ